MNDGIAGALLLIAREMARFNDAYEKVHSVEIRQEEKRRLIHNGSDQ